MLQASQITCEREFRLLFKNLSFELMPGEVLRVLGPNGSGKTTLLRIICGLFSDFEGEVSWDENESMLFLGHAPGVKSNLTVLENLSWLVALGDERSVSESLLLSALAEVGLKGYEDVFCGSLSAGQRKRVNLARLYVMQNRLWVLDEPFSAIDVAGVASLQQRMVEHVESGGMLVITSHQEFEFPQPPKVLELTG